MNGLPYCDLCGGRLTGGRDAHPACCAARALEPPRYCAECGRRMVVQVTPLGWSSHCSRHGTTTSGR